MTDPLPPSAPDRLALTGGSGRVGRLLAHVWAGADVAWIGRGDPGTVALTGRRCLIALAGVTSGDAAALAMNAVLARDALEAARAAGVGRVLLLSSAAVYGRRTGSLEETMAPTPASPYGAAKADLEAAVARWRATDPGGTEAVCLRLGNVAGADALLGRLGAAPPVLDVFTDGRGPRRSYVGPVTLAHVLAGLAAHPGPLPPVLNVAAGVVDMAALLAAAGRDWTPRAAPPEAIAEVALDTRLLEGLVPVPEDARRPDRMVAEWRGLAP
ncbi:NAD-dependent epimerase/dehydratase family protein [Jannaschia rubra]|uniref:UDP-glucose 4-epimerase n=1 Tax=Jannaschia rubra TaxID=282197 RepID=A0A0M6XPB6_9RHOB|nr:NAD-dependent epimerase/dehydratase family protein [Jannaschia rubra]CTQ32522.1 UDP-glucose 4-epimerase [Jannaschia rubra]SFF84103.1 Nucleoside-diphosphate-sugar epimerase [Jannaschia rubra]